MRRTQSAASDMMIFLICSVALISILKGIHPPDAWALTQYQTDYRFGFVKRGFFGAIMGKMIGEFWHQRVVLNFVSYVLSALLLTLTAAVLRPLWRNGDGGRWLMGLAASSYAVTYLASMVGYLDIIMLIIALCGLLMPNQPWRLPAVFALGGIGILVHEAYVVAFLPLTLLPIFLQMVIVGDKRLMVQIALGLLLMAAMTVIIAAAPSLSEHDVEKLRLMIISDVDYTVDQEYFMVLCRSAADNLRFTLDVWRNPSRWLVAMLSFASFLPAAILMLWAAVNALPADLSLFQRRFLVGYVICCGLSPLMLNVAGTDIHRWNSLAVVTSTMALASVVRLRLPGDQIIRLGSQGVPLVVLLIATNMASGHGLFDGRQIDPFPFINHLSTLG